MLLAVTLAAIFYGSTFALVLAWTGWSISKHGWCRRSLRRFSYLLFLLLLAVRLAWCGVLYAHLLVRPSAQMHALRSTPAVVLDHAAFLVHFLVFSMLVCGWADSIKLMMSGRSLQPTAVRAPTIFYHIGGAFVAINLLNAFVAVGTLAPLLLERSGLTGGGHLPPTPGSPASTNGGTGYFGGSGVQEEPSEPLVSFALWMSALSAGCFSLLLAASSTVAGALVSCKIRNIADVEPALRSFAHQKMIKVSERASERASAFFFLHTRQHHPRGRASIFFGAWRRRRLRLLSLAMLAARPDARDPPARVPARCRWRWLRASSRAFQFSPQGE